MWTVGFILVMVLAACGESSSRELEQRVATLESQLATPVPHRARLFALDEDSIVHIQVSHAGRTVDYDRKPQDSTTWFIQENGEETRVFQGKWSGTTLLLSGIQLNRTVVSPLDNLAVAPSFDNLSSYGLEPPETVVKVTERSGLVYEFHMGSTPPDSGERYIYLLGDPTFFTVTDLWWQVITNLAKRPPYPPR